MLLVSDRAAEGAQLRTTLDAIAPCALVPLHQPAAPAVADTILVCDVALDNAPSVELLRTAIGRHRASPDTPVLVLVRDPSQLALAQAAALGATQVLPYQTPKPALLTAIKALMRRGGAVRPVADSLVSEVREANAALTDILGAAERSHLISKASLDRGGRIVLAAIARTDVQAWLDVVWTYDDITYQHSLLVAGLVAALAQELGLTEAMQGLLSQAALVHDIGKAEIPRAVLNKAGQLSSEEVAIMRTHPLRGYRMLATQTGFDPRLLDIVLHHHEVLDGTGYPHGLRGGAISRFVRLATICDIYAAMIERRSYKQPVPPEQAFATLVQMGRKLDPGLLQVFRAVVL